MTETQFLNPADTRASTITWLRSVGFTEDRSGWFRWRASRPPNGDPSMPAEVRIILHEPAYAGAAPRMRVSGFAPERGGVAAECWTFQFEGTPLRFLRAVLTQAGVSGAQG